VVAVVDVVVVIAAAAGTVCSRALGLEAIEPLVLLGV